jgi:glycerol-3-phosphate dehydrogenase
MIAFAVQEEMALKLSDVIFRRTGLGSAGKPPGNSLEQCAEFMAAELGWDKAKKEIEIDGVKEKYNKLGIG